MITCAFCGEEQGFAASEIEVNGNNYPLCNECSRLFTIIKDCHDFKDVSYEINEIRPRLNINPEKVELQNYTDIYLNSNGKSKADVKEEITNGLGIQKSNIPPILLEYNSEYKRKGLICILNGARGRRMTIYDRKCEIKTDVTLGSIITNNAADGIKTIFYSDIVGIQFKKTGALIGYLQLETATSQMNNLGSNAFSENTFTYEPANGISDELMDQVYEFLQKKVEGYKYNDDELINAEIPPLLLEQKEKFDEIIRSAFGTQEHPYWEH